MVKVLLFDFDGTIADSFEHFLVIISTLSGKYNLPDLSREEIDTLRSEDPRTIIKRLRVPFYKIPLIARDMKKQQEKQIELVKPFNGLPSVLSELKDFGYDLGIITSNGKANVERFLTNHNLEMFTYVYSDSSMFGKDRVISTFLKENNVAKKDVVYIGDEIRDIVACQKAGIGMIAVTWGFNSREGLIKYTPQAIVDNPRELLQAIKEFTAE